MNVLFISCIYSEIQKDEFLHNSKRGYQFAAQNFQEALLDGFISNGIKPYVLTVPPLSTFPMGYRKSYVKTVDFLYKGENLGKSFGYLNVPFMKKEAIYKLKRSAKEWCCSVNGDKYVLVYGLHPNLMSISVELKQKFENVKIGILVPDLPQFMGCNKYYKKLGIQRRNIEKVNMLINDFDSYIVLSEPMLNKLGIVQKPYVVVEGIYSCTEMNITKEINSNIKSILYTGGLMLRYGIGLLVDAFMKIEGDDYKLLFCGFGDAVDYIKECMEKDKRIEYKGMLPKAEIMKLQRNATILVNPRLASEEFTVYSFPSKTMEYMASETPTVMFRLKCLPTEYEQYLFFFENETVDSMAETMKSICEMDKKKLAIIGEKASRFIRYNKNATIQVGKIVNILKEC